LILISVAFNGIFKSQGVKVKPMVCKDSKQNEQEMLGNKNFYKKNAKPATFQQERLLFFSNLLRFHAVNMKDFRSNLRATYTLNALQKLMQKDFFLATDATTQSSNKEENEAIFLFFLFNCKITQQGKMLTSTKPRE
jgi:hypothetical protein